MSGPLPQPSNIRALNGNRGKRGYNKSEPDPEYLVDLDPPAHLPEYVAIVWREVAPMAAKQKVLTVADKLSFEILCREVASYRLACAQVDKYGELAKGSPSGWSICRSMYSKQALQYLDRFGLNPAARSKIMVAPQLDLPLGPSDGKSPSRFFAA